MSNDASIKAAFQSNVFLLPATSITPLKEIPPSLRTTTKYRQIEASLQHVGLIEPPVVFPANPDQYWLLDGTVRFDILKRNGSEIIKCLLATDDEAYTFNKRVNALPPIAEHYMILKAIDNGVSEHAIASALNVDVAEIRKKRNLLDGICPEAVELLKDKRTTTRTLALLRRMKPIRQVEAAELMTASNTYSARFARALVAVTKPEFLVKPTKARRVSAARSAAMDDELHNLLRDLRAAEQSYGTDILNLTVSGRFLENLLKNGEIYKFLSKHYGELLAEIEKLLSEISADRTSARAPQKRGRSSKTDI